MAAFLVYLTSNHTHCASVAARALIEITCQNLLTSRPYSLLIEIAKFQYAFSTGTAFES